MSDWYVPAFCRWPWRLIRLDSCLRCGLVVHRWDRDDHDNWHDRLLAIQCDRAREHEEAE